MIGFGRIWIFRQSLRFSLRLNNFQQRDHIFQTIYQEIWIWEMKAINHFCNPGHCVTSKVLSFNDTKKIQIAVILFKFVRPKLLFFTSFWESCQCNGRKYWIKRQNNKRMFWMIWQSAHVGTSMTELHWTPNEWVGKTRGPFTLIQIIIPKRCW